jgi:methyltransferase (TIGR00027 family)
VNDRPSSTAQIVATGTLVLSRSSLGHLIPQTSARLAAECLVRCGAMGRILARAAASATGRAALRGLERALIPGLALHHALRKRAIDDAIRRACAAGYRRLIVLGAGFDALAARHAHAMETIEIDHPATQRVKTAALAALGLTPPHMIAADLDSPPALPPSERAPTVIVAEGVLMYLRPESVWRLLEWTARQPGRIRLLFTVMDGDPPGFCDQSPLVRLWMRLRHEPFRWAKSRSEIGAIMAVSGYRLRDAADSVLLRRRYAVDLPAAVGECLYEAERREETSPRHRRWRAAPTLEHDEPNVIGHRHAGGRAELRGDRIKIPALPSRRQHNVPFSDPDDEGESCFAEQIAPPRDFPVGTYGRACVALRTLRGGGQGPCLFQGERAGSRVPTQPSPEQDGSNPAPHVRNADQADRDRQNP